MATYHSEPNRSSPETVRAPNGWRIMRNGQIYARRETLGEARAVVRNVIRTVGNSDRWAILDAAGDDQGAHS